MFQNDELGERLKFLPIWMFQGERDNVADISLSNQRFAQLEAAGAVDAVQFIYPHREHNAWTPMHWNPDLYEWFLAHRRGGEGARQPLNDDERRYIDEWKSAISNMEIEESVIRRTMSGAAASR
jgi:hypothetical protein